MDLDNRVGRTCPLWYRGRVVSEGSVVDFVDEDAEKGSSLIVRVGLEVGVDFDNECRGDGREQTSLLPVLVYVHQNFIGNLRRSGSCSNLHHTSL